MFIEPIGMARFKASAGERFLATEDFGEMARASRRGAVKMSSPGAQGLSEALYFHPVEAESSAER